MLLMLLHNYGYVYCDLKPENILFDTRRAMFRLVDFGGVREIGSSVTQFTPAFDRASYNCGTRQADPGFDAFALAALMVALATGKDPQPRSPELVDTPAILASVWKKARQNKLKDVAELLRECDGYMKCNLLPSGRIRIAIYCLGLFSLVIFSITIICLLH
jgi:serine/threonine protein kinase